VSICQFSIIIPTRSRPDPLAACLDSLERLQFERDRFEVIVVDDAGHIPLDEIVSAHRGVSARLIRQPPGGPAAARDAGAAQARGEFLAFTDDDCAPAPDWLTALATRLALTPDHAVGGRTVNALPDNPYSAASQNLVTYFSAHFNSDPDDARFFASNNFAAPAESFRAMGGFGKFLPFAGAEDRDFCDRWRSRGYRMSYAPEAVAHHAHALNFRSFWRQHYNYGRGAFHYRRSRGRRPESFEPLSFYLNLIRYPLAHSRASREAAAGVMLMIVSQAATAAGFARERFAPQKRR